jgi:hypothetical protein
MKQLTVLALVLAVLTGWGATQAFGDALFYMVPDTQVVAGGANFTRTFLVSGNTAPIEAWQVTIFYDSTVVSPTATATEGSFLKKYGSTIFIGPEWFGDGLAFAALFFPLNYSPDAAGTLATITFTAKNKPGTNSTAITSLCDPSNSCLIDTLGGYPPLTFKNGLVTVNGPSGVEENSLVGNQKMEVRPTPNPFASFATIPGYEAERFALYDISGRLVGIYRGDRIGEGLSPGVYFLKPEARGGRPLRVVKLR